MHLLLLADAVVPGSERVVASGPILYLVGIASTALFAAATWAILELRKKLAAQTEQTWKTTLFAELGTFAETVVHEMEATIRAQFALARADGKLTAAEIDQIRAVAMTRMKELVTSAGLGRIRRAFGWDERTVDAQLRGILEKKVVESKVAAAIAKSGSLAAATTSSFGGK